MISGYDVSHHQGRIDWEKVEADFVIMKATQGTSFVDPRFLENKKKGRDRGILLGYYHFANGSDAQKEADHFVDTVGEIKQYEFLALDWEIQHPAPAQWCREFLDRVAEKVGFKPLIYMNESTAKNPHWKLVADGNYGLWCAKYLWLDIGLPGLKPKPGAWPFWVLWQYSSKGRRPGFTGNVDLNQSDITLGVLQKYGKQIATPEPECSHSCPRHCDV